MSLIYLLKLLSHRQITPEVIEKARKGAIESGMCITTCYEMCGGEIELRNSLRGSGYGSELVYHYNAAGKLTRREISSYNSAGGVYTRRAKKYTYDPPGRFFGRRIQ